MNVEQIQQYLRNNDLDGWLMADFHGRNDVAMAILGITGMLTRRAFYFIPADGDPVAWVNPIEVAKFRHLPGIVRTYRGWRGLESAVSETVRGCKRIAMEYSHRGRLPYIGLVDAGTIELVRATGVEIVSSADLVANFEARLSLEQQAAHRRAAKHVIEIKDMAFAKISDHIKGGTTITEYDVTSFIVEEFTKRNMVRDHDPNCSVGPHAGDPHYEPRATTSSKITRGDLVLIDLWGKEDTPEGVVADITWMAFAGARDDIPERYQEIFSVLRTARDTAVGFLKEHIGNRTVRGFEVDDACRKVIEEAGYGGFFTHRTGHSIAGATHGPGPNIDNLETEDARELQDGHLFSIEPGIYMDDCGFRTEIDCLITAAGPEVTTLPLQSEILALL